MSFAKPNEFNLRMNRVVKDFYNSGCPYQEALRQFRRAFLGSMLDGARHNQCAVAQALHLHRNTVGHMVAELGLRRERKPIAKGVRGMVPPPTELTQPNEDTVARVLASFPDAALHTELTREKTVLYLCVSHQRSDLARINKGQVTQWLSAWCFSPGEAWEDAERRLRTKEIA
jgi:hypothetical protein